MRITLGRLMLGAWLATGASGMRSFAAEPSPMLTPPAAADSQASHEGSSAREACCAAEAEPETSGSGAASGHAQAEPGNAAATAHGTENRLAAAHSASPPAALPAPARVASARHSDELLGAMWRLQSRLEQLEHENRKLSSNLYQLQGTTAHQGRSSRFFHVSPLRDPDVGRLGPAPFDYHADLAAVQQSSGVHAPLGEALLPSDAHNPCCCQHCIQDCRYGTAEGGTGFGGEGAFAFSIDWLNWKPNRNGLDFLITGDDANAAIGPGNLKRARTGRDDGIRLSLFRRSTSGWDFGIRYTDFDARGGNNVFDPVGLMSATRIHPTGADIGDADIAHARSRYRLRYDLVDLEVGRWFAVGATGAVRTFAGLRSARIDQRLRTLYSDTPGFDAGNIVVVDEAANMSSVGLLVGGETHWHLSGCLRLFGRTAAGLHVGTFDVSNFQFEPNDDEINVQVKDDHRDMVFSFEAAAGVGCRIWDRRRSALDLEVGYELQYWDNLADFVRFVDDAFDALNDRSTVSLGLDGLFVRLILTR